MREVEEGEEGDGGREGGLVLSFCAITFMQMFTDVIVVALYYTPIRHVGNSCVIVACCESSEGHVLMRR